MIKGSFQKVHFAVLMVSEVSSKFWNLQYLKEKGLITQSHGFRGCRGFH